jgi:hypothetical protein
MDKIAGIEEITIYSTEPLVFIGAGELFVKGVTPDRLKTFIEKKYGAIRVGTYAIKLSEVV